MASRPKDNSREDDAKKSTARKSPATKKDASNAVPSDAKGKKSVGKKPAKDSETITGKGAGKTPKSSHKSVKDFHLYLSKKFAHEQSVLAKDRAILDHLVFAIFLESASFVQARHAFMEIIHNFVDWNEVRVAKANEIAAVVGDVPDVVVAGERLRRLLQWIFDKTFDFDLEPLRQKGEKDVVEFISNIPYATSFMKDYVALFAFDGKKLPLSEGSLRVLRRLALVEAVDGKESLIGSDKLLNKEEIRAFFFELHELGIKYVNEEEHDEALKTLEAFDKTVSKRDDAPLVKLPTTDPIEIARLLAKKEKDAAGKSSPSPMFGNPSESDLDEDSEDYEMDSDGAEDSQSVAETELSGGETTFHGDKTEAPVDKSSRRERKRSTSQSFKSDSGEDELFVAVGQDNPTKEPKGVSTKKISKKTRSSRGGETAESVSVDDSPVKPPKAEKTKKSKSAETEKATSKRPGNADASNVASSEPPDSHRKKKDSSDKVRSNTGSSDDDSVVETSEKTAKRVKSKESSAKTSSKGTSKLKEIQQKKPR